MIVFQVGCGSNDQTPTEMPVSEIEQFLKENPQYLEEEDEDEMAFDPELDADMLE